MNKLDFYQPKQVITHNDYVENSLSNIPKQELILFQTESDSPFKIDVSPKSVNILDKIDSSLTPYFKTKKLSEVKKNKETKSPNANGSPTNNSLHCSLFASKSKWSIVNFIFFKFLIPLTFFTAVICFLILMQIWINDFCFYPDMCHCQNIGIFAYTMFREFLEFDVLTYAWFYFAVGYLTMNFYEKFLLKIFFFALEFLSFAIFFAIYYSRRYEGLLADLRVTRGFLSLGISTLFVLFFTFTYKKFSKNFFKKFAIMGFFTSYYVFHGLYLKNTYSFYFLKFLQNNFEKNFALNIFKLVLLVYYLFYQNFAKYCIFYFYKDIIKESNEFPNMVVAVTKFINIDILSIKVMNVLTIPLTEVYSWISFILYIYSLISIYLRVNLPKILLIKILKKFFGKQLKPEKKSEESKNYDEMRSGCILEANLIIFIRILLNQYFNYFFYMTKIKQLYKDCTLEGSPFKFHLLFQNIILIFVSQICLIVVILIYMVKKKKSLLNLVVENFSLPLRVIFFIIYYEQVDVCIQFYMLLESYQ